MKKKLYTSILLIFLIVPILSSTVSPYVLPASQIIALMTNKFATVQTLTITQHTNVRDIHQKKAKAFHESVSLGSPYLYRSEIPDQPGKRLIIHNDLETLRIIDKKIIYEGASYDFIYRFLLLSHDPSQLLKMLQSIGINTEKTFLTRFDGKIAYLIGEKNEGSARLIIDKELFLPLFLKYGDYRFHFSDYSEYTKNIWYPFQIVYSYKEKVTEEYTIIDIKANLPIDITRFDIPQIKADFNKGELNQQKE